MKVLEFVNEREFNPVDRVCGLLSDVPTLEIGLVDYETKGGRDELIDARIDFSHSGVEYALCHRGQVERGLLASCGLLSIDSKAIWRIFIEAVILTLADASS